MFDNPYLAHHKRFVAAAGLGLGVYLAAPVLGVAGELRLLVAGDVFFLVYLLAKLPILFRSSPEDLRERAKTEDEGILLISGLTLVAVSFSLISILTLLNEGDGPDRLSLVLAILSVPMGWLTLHIMAAQHYAELFYAPGDPTAGEAAAGEAGGLDFPGTKAPDSLDFLYFSLVIGMTAQTADVSITGRAMRRAVLAHSVASFFYNTVLVAVGVNAAIAGGS